jgi:hypothetical protein
VSVLVPQEKFKKRVQEMLKEEMMKYITNQAAQ